MTHDVEAADEQQINLRETKCNALEKMSGGCWVSAGTTSDWTLQSLQHRYVESRSEAENVPVDATERHLRLLPTDSNQQTPAAPSPSSFHHSVEKNSTEIKLILVCLMDKKISYLVQIQNFSLEKQLYLDQTDELVASPRKAEMEALL